MLSALSMGEVGAIILVDGQAEATFEAADVVLEEVGVLVEIDGLESELSETLTAVGVGDRGRGDATAAKLGAGTVLYGG